MNREYVENLINDLKAIEFGKDYIINGNELCELKKYLINIHNKLDQLTNNWNELEKWLESENKKMKELAPKHNIIGHFEIVLDKMKEIKEKNK